MTTFDNHLSALAAAAYQASRGRPGRSRRKRLNAAHRLRAACLSAIGAPCHLCGSQTPDRLLGTRTPTWDACAALPAHAALLGAARQPGRIARYAAAAASPRVKPVCSACLPAARIHAHLETLHSACHGPNSTRTIA